MALPLYKDCHPAKHADYHAGLWFDRFFNRYDNQWQVPKDDSGKLAWIRTVCGSVGGQAATDFAARQKQFVSRLNGETITVNTEWHFVTGLGKNHPIENGFAWHPTLGVPYLTGAAVKGLLRGWCEQWAEFREDKNKIRQWFGPSLEELNPRRGSNIVKQKHATGELIFFDAIPTGPVKLVPDVMTPHMDKWYEEGDEDPKPDGSNVPADWHNPMPVPFLAVAPKQEFQFSITTRAGSTIDVADVMVQLQEALEYLGAGAKTATGYGRMTSPEAAAREWLQKTIAKLRNSKDFIGQPEDTLWKKALSEEYLIAGNEIRKCALPMIQQKWKELRIDWDHPVGKSAQAAKSNFINGMPA